MSASGWTQKVFRLRGLPSRISSPQDAASLLGETLGLPSDHIIIYSLAKTSNKWGPLFKVATVQFKSNPPNLDLETSSTEWKFRILGSLHNQDLILDTHFKGMTVLNDVETENHRADCIAISGLASHPFGSWQPHGQDKSFMWIRDELPIFVPGVRAVLYGYDSQLIGSNSFQSISDIAVSLIWNLKSGGWNLPSSQPIIFLAHSLGGIMLKEAIVQMADSTNQSVAGIIDNLLGAIMFGVPSLGMQQSHLMAMVEGQANEMLVQDLSRENGSSYVRQLKKAFNGLSVLHKVKILWAYETEESPTIVKRSDGSWCKKGPLAVLVNPDSATCHYHRENMSLTIPINKNHSNMVKFSQGDNDLDKVIFSLNDFFEERGGEALLVANDASQGRQPLLGVNMDYQSAAEDVFTKDDKLLIDLGSILMSIQEVHDKLYLPELNYRINQIEDPFQNTFKWIFDLDFFTHWLREGSGLFWINGKPGSGKSTLMKYIFQNSLTWDLLHNWRTRSLDIKACFFFHYRGTAMQKSFEGVLRRLIIQVLQPHRLTFQKQYQELWEQYQHEKQKYRTLKGQRDNFQYKLDVIIARNAPNSSEIDLKKRLQQKLDQLQADIAVVSQTISSLAEKVRPFQTQPETNLLRSVVVEFRNDSNPQIISLERILSQLLDQDMVGMDLVLFFDALDEFDGHLDKMSGFLKSLVERSATSATRVKVCFSSRPWKSLNGHFASYPGFSLQDHTKSDIEQYAMGSLVRSEAINSSERDKITKFIPSIIAQANGVLLWVRLALKELLDTIIKNPEEAQLSDRLEQKLQELPTDLFEFYKLIIDRISETNRRYTFALLELLARHAGPPVTVTDIWGAVLTSGCATFQESLDALQRQSIATSDRKQKVTNDISTWGGGLVEIKAQNHLQLMHQTVLEFVMGLLFKRIVLGDVAAILKENGHSFYFKYWVTTTGFGRHETAKNTEPWIVALKSRQSSVEKQEERKLAAYHGEKSELTTGISQLDFIYSVPSADLGRLLHSTSRTYCGHTPLLNFASSHGLTLCIRDWIVRNPGRLQDISKPQLLCLQRAPPSLLASLAFDPAGGVFHERYLIIAHLLLENGYSIARDTDFFPRLLETLWKAEGKEVAHERNAQAASMPAIYKLATLVLDHGQDPNIFSFIFSRENLPKCTALHVAPPNLAAELIRCNANVNTPDSWGRTPLDWVLRPPRWSVHWSCARRYEMCCLLVNAGGLMSRLTPASLDECPA